MNPKFDKESKLHFMISRVFGEQRNNLSPIQLLEEHGNPGEA